MNGTLFFVLGSCLAVLAGAVTFIGLRDSEAFASNRLSRAAMLLFLVLVVGTTVFAVRHSSDEQADRRAELAAEKGAETETGGPSPATTEAGGAAKPPAATIGETPMLPNRHNPRMDSSLFTRQL